MAGPQNISNDQTGQNGYHTFMMYPEWEERLPGIVVPQRAYPLPRGQQHEKLLLSIPFSIRGNPGIKLSAILEHKHAVLPVDNSIPDSELADLPRRPSLRIRWPGYDEWNFDNALDLGDVGSAHRALAWIAHRVATRLLEFYNAMCTKKCGEPSWELQRIPFESLYLVELRGVSKAAWQPVICSDIS